MARMRRRRLLFVDVPRRAGSAPIHLAIAALLLVALVDFTVAAWPDDSMAAQRPAGSTQPAAGQSFHGGSPNGPARGPMRWM